MTTCKHPGNDHFLWVDRFACPALFSWHTAKNVTRDTAMVVADFNARDHATPMDLFAFNHTLDPTKVKIVERERVEDEPLLFDEGGSGNQAGQRGSTGVGEGTNIQQVTEAIGIVIEDMAPLQPRRQRKRKIVVADAGGSSHLPKKLREDHGTSSGPSVAGKSRFAIHRLLAGAMMNAEVKGEPIPTLPFVTSSVSVTPEREGENHTDFMTGLNLRTISVMQRFIISSDSSHHSGANVVEAEVDSVVRSSVLVMTVVTITTYMINPAVFVKEKTVKPSLFAVDSFFAGGVDPNAGVFLDLTESDFLFSGVHTVIDPDTDLQKVYMVLKEAEAAEAIHLRVEASNFVTVEKSLRDKVNIVNERNTILEKERDALDVKVADIEASVVTKECEMTDLNA
uniref:Uncharacterized protein n=1 Tax=Tanacetum cinerariifolium TaxID=118510 RepID=A0A699K6T4_TANCI|nr:hypothetical protein [Tanacetum cinerariifolium]